MNEIGTNGSNGTVNREVNCPTCKGKGLVTHEYLERRRQRKTVAVPMREWSHAGHVEYRISRDGETASLMFALGTEPESKRVILGRCSRHKKTSTWMAYHKDGHAVYFVSPIPIGYGMVTGHYRRKPDPKGPYQRETYRD